MKYLLTIYGNKELWESMPAEEWPSIIATQDAWNKEYMRSGELIGAYGMSELDQVKVISVRDGVPTVIDGPYLETKEYMGSTYILDVPTDERALEIAISAPFASYRSVELWPMTHEAPPVED